MKTAYYVAACSQESRGGIYGFDRNNRITFFEPLKGTNYFAFSPDHKFFYASGADGEVNYAAVYAIHEDGSLQYIDRRATHGSSCCHLTTDTTGNFLYTANYRSGTFNEFRLRNGIFACEEPGILTEMRGKLGPNANRQEHAHAHCTVFTPDNRYLCVVDLGLDEVQLFAYTRGKGIDTNPVFHYHSFKAGAGPRHLLFSPDKTTAWLANELDNTVSVLGYENGTLTHRQTLSTIPDDFTEFTKASAIRLSPNHQHLCVSNRGHESFACYHVHDDGSLERYAIVPAGGISPRDINFLPWGDEFVCCNETSNDMTIFHYDAKTGDFCQTGKIENLPRALCAVYP